MCSNLVQLGQGSSGTCSFSLFMTTILIKGTRLSSASQTTELLQFLATIIARAGSYRVYEISANP